MTSVAPRVSSYRTLCDAFIATSTRVPDSLALRTPQDGVTVTWRLYGARVRAIAAGLAGLGVARGDTVGIMLTNRPEFHLVDTAALCVGATPFSVYNTLTADQITHLFNNAGNRVVICEGQFVDKVKAAAAASKVEHIVCVDAAPAGTITLTDLEQSPAADFDFDASWRAVEPGDVATIIYTSGTTGAPKGVELTHASLLAELEALEDVTQVTERDKVVSYLPDAHIANRWGAHYTSLATGLQITTVADTKQLIAALPDTRPTFFGAVPQIWYKIKTAIESAIAAEQSTPKRRLAEWAISVGRHRARTLSDGKSVSPVLAAQHLVADRLVLSKLRARLGFDRVRFAASGAAAIAPEALEFILGLGIPCCECWGMSEISAVGIINPADAIRIGTVGKALKNVELRIAEDGELLVRGPLLMKGYRDEPEKTAETIDADGWLHTGDIATIDAEGYVRIVDRKKELIINAAGKNMSPANIESAIRAYCPLVGSAVAIGDDRPFVVALLTLDPDAAAAFAARHGITSTDLASDPTVRAAVDAGIAEANEHLARVEQIKKSTLLPVVWEPGGDEITPTMKLKRRPIAEKYAPQIEALYAR